MRIEIKRTGKIDIPDVVARSNIRNQPTAERELKRFIDLSFESWAGYIDGEIAAVWGLIAPTVLSNRAYLWLVTTELMDQHPFTLVRHSQMVVEDMLKMFKTIEGHVLENEQRSIRWLKWLGFQMTMPPQKGLIKFLRSA